jgi:hypothetical protein
MRIAGFRVAWAKPAWARLYGTGQGFKLAYDALLTISNSIRPINIVCIVAIQWMA